MSVLDKLLDAVKLNDDYDDDDDFLDEDLLDGEDDDFLDDDESGQKPVKKFFEKFGHKKDEADEDFDDEPDNEPVRTSVKQASKETAASRTALKHEKTSRTASSKITPMRASRKNTSSVPAMEVCVIKPTSMEDAREIADTLVDNCTVVLNLEGIDMNLAQRIFDFASGACYSLDGTVQEVSTYIIILGPSGVNITGDMKNILAGSAASVRAGY